MITIVLKYLFIFFFTIYICLKSVPNFELSSTKNFIVSFGLSLLAYFLSTYNDGVNYIIPLLLLWIATSIINANPKLSFVAIIISFTISFCLHAIASFVIIFFMVPIVNITELLSVLALATGLVQSLLIKCIFSTKRFKKGIPFLSSPSFIDIGVVFCLLFIGFILFTSINYNQFHIKTFVLCSFVIILAFLIYWWQAQITKAYRRVLDERNQESKRIADLEKDIYIQKLLQDNDRLATISHRDNTLLTTLANSTCDYLERDYVDWEADAEVRKSMVADIRKLQASRRNDSNNQTEKSARVFDTGLTLLNQLLHQMDSDALKADITFSAHVGTMLDEFVPSTIPEIDLVHLVDDLLKNAFKATRNLESREVRLQFYKVGKHFVLEVADSGIPFEAESLVLLGLEKRTTYEDGTGIGLVDIWNTKEKLRATYHIEEYETPSPFTKKISLTFDGKNRYSIRTTRKDEILKISKRADLQVYDF